jgi:hypothetical protein
MSKVNVVGSTASFFCPACKNFHSLNTVENGLPRWGFNGDIEKPTFTPSVLLRSGHFTSGFKVGDSCWCTYNAEHPEDVTEGFECVVCHSFVTDGRIQYLSDCTHALAGQTVDLPEYPK